MSVPELRASDADRERVVAQLREAATEGRLDPAELEERVAGAYAARTYADLEPLTADLPGGAAAAGLPVEREAGRRVLARVGPYVIVNLLLVAIWAATGGQYFWPIWPILGWGAGIALGLWQERFGDGGDGDEEREERERAR